MSYQTRTEKYLWYPVVVYKWWLLRCLWVGVWGRILLWSCLWQWIFWVGEEGMGSFWENLGLALKSNFFPLFFSLIIVHGADLSDVCVFCYVNYFEGVILCSYLFSWIFWHVWERLWGIPYSIHIVWLQIWCRSRVIKRRGPQIPVILLFHGDIE